MDGQKPEKYGVTNANKICGKGPAEPLGSLPNTEKGGAREARAPLLDVLKAAKWFGWALSTYFIGICHPIFF